VSSKDYPKTQTTFRMFTPEYNGHRANVALTFRGDGEDSIIEMWTAFTNMIDHGWVPAYGFASPSEQNVATTPSPQNAPAPQNPQQYDNNEPMAWDEFNAQPATTHSAANPPVQSMAKSQAAMQTAQQLDATNTMKLAGKIGGLGDPGHQFMPCPIHGGEMPLKRYEKQEEGRYWYSHKVQGEWCRGK